ncbi:uncharacterized protein LOC141602306 [Silene latifolia]|uniref:uncharacterized protein LOC141602306 n=1 Tax=Silene latifolia TaxID=37657 RepID=UPI003D77C36C
MAPQNVTIAAMVPSKSRYQITARATRIWEVGANQNAKPLSLDMVLLDTKGEHIHATIPQKWIRSFKDDIQEGRIYEVAHFEVAKNNRGYRPVHTNENLIKFTPFTSIIEQPEESNKIEKHKFEFHQLDLIHERNNKTDYLIDVIGVLTGVENKTEVRTEKGITEIRNIYIEDERQNEVKATLWGEAANFVSEADTRGPGVNKIIVITSTRVARYKDEYQLSSTYGTKVYINIQIPEAKNLLERIAKPRKVQQIENNKQELTDEVMMASTKTLMELTEMELTDPEKGKQKVYEILQDCVGRQFTFKVMIGTTNYGDTRELKDPKKGAQEIDTVMEPKTPEKAKQKTSEGHNEDNTTKRPMENSLETNKRQRTQED